MSDSKIFSDEEEAISEVKEKQAIPAYRFSERRCYNPVELPDEKHEERRTSIVEEPYNIFTSPETSAISLIDEVRGIKINDEMLSSSSSLLKFFDSSNIDYAEDFPEGLTAEFRSLDVYYRFHVAKLVRSVLKGRPIVNDIFTLSKIAKKNPEICSYKYETQVVFQALSETGFEQQNFNDENYKMLEQILLNNKVHLKSAISKTLIRHKVNSLAELITGCGDKNQTIATTPNESCPEIFAIFVNTFLCPKEKLLSLLEENGMKMYMEASCLERTGPIEMRKYLQEFTSSDCHFLPDPDYPNIFLFKQSFRDKLLTLDLVKEKKAVPIGLSMISTANLALKRIFDERRIEAFVDDSTPQTCAVSYERSGSAIVLVYMAVLWAEKCKNRSADRMSIFIENYDTRRKVKSALQEYNIFSRKISMNSSPLSETYSKELASRISALIIFSDTGRENVLEPLDMVAYEEENLHWLTHNIELSNDLDILFPDIDTGSKERQAEAEKKRLKNAQLTTARILKHVVDNFPCLNLVVYSTYSNNFQDNETLLMDVINEHNATLGHKEKVVRKNTKKHYNPHLYAPFELEKFSNNHLIAPNGQLKSARSNECASCFHLCDKNTAFIAICQKNIINRKKRDLALIRAAIERGQVTLPDEQKNHNVEEINDDEKEIIMKKINEAELKRKASREIKKAAKVKSSTSISNVSVPLRPQKSHPALYDEATIKEKARKKVVKVLPHQEVVKHPHPFRF